MFFGEKLRLFVYENKSHPEQLLRQFTQALQRKMRENPD
jgi:hypothetical protein